MKRRSSIYQYLSSSGILDHGSDEQIKNARREYWREYGRKWRKKKRNKEQEITISLKSEELILLTREAKRHKISRTRFLKDSSLAYMSKTFVVPEG
jgi:hypothetical protein